MASLETDLQSRGIALLCCPAQPEIEIYACVAFRDDLPGTWEDAPRASYWELTQVSSMRGSGPAGWKTRMKEEVFDRYCRGTAIRGRRAAVEK